MSVSDLEKSIQAKANEASASIRAAWGKIQEMMAEDVPQYAAMAAAVEQDRLVQSAMRAVLPSQVRSLLADLTDAVAAIPEIQAAARAEHSAAGGHAADPTAPAPDTVPSTATADAGGPSSSDPAGTSAPDPAPAADPYAAP